MDFSPTVITSKPAQDHVDMIKEQHSALLNDIASQSAMVSSYNQQQSMDNERRSLQQAQQNKEEMEANRKMKELEIKQLALGQ